MTREELQAMLGQFRSESETMRAENRAFHADVKTTLAEVRGASEKSTVAVESLRHSQNIVAAYTTAIIGVLVAVGITVSGYILTRVTSIQDDLRLLTTSVVQPSSPPTAARRLAVRKGNPRHNRRPRNPNSRVSDI